MAGPPRSTQRLPRGGSRRPTEPAAATGSGRPLVPNWGGADPKGRPLFISPINVTDPLARRRSRPRGSGPASFPKDLPLEEVGQPVPEQPRPPWRPIGRQQLLHPRVPLGEQ